MNDFAEWDKDASPYHEGEKELHERLGRGAIQEKVARRFHKTFMPDQHRDFYEQLAYLIVGSVDKDGWPWASIIHGPPGFVTTPTEHLMRLNLNTIPGDPIKERIAANASISILGIQLETRRRNRMNGVVSKHHGDQIEIDVVQAFGNCPQYIQTRDYIYKPSSANPTAPRQLNILDEETTEIIRKADTFFVATSNPFDDIRDVGGVDVNHRGGPPGFINIEGNKLTIPDYRGNSSFNTLGNMLRYPKAGLLFVNFDSNVILMLSGNAELHWDLTQDAALMPGAERSWSVTVNRGLLIENALPFQWEFGELSPSFRRFT